MRCTIEILPIRRIGRPLEYYWRMEVYAGIKTLRVCDKDAATAFHARGEDARRDAVMVVKAMGWDFVEHECSSFRSEVG